jgi:hypothetical protein
MAQDKMTGIDTTKISQYVKLDVPIDRKGKLKRLTFL